MELSTRMRSREKRKDNKNMIKKMKWKQENNKKEGIMKDEEEIQ